MGSLCRKNTFLRTCLDREGWCYNAQTWGCLRCLPNVRQFLGLYQAYAVPCKPDIEIHVGTPGSCQINATIGFMLSLCWTDLGTVEPGPVLAYFVAIQSLCCADLVAETPQPQLAVVEVFLRCFFGGQPWPYIQPMLGHDSEPDLFVGLKTRCAAQHWVVFTKKNILAFWCLAMHTLAFRKYGDSLSAWCKKWLFQRRLLGSNWRVNLADHRWSTAFYWGTCLTATQESQAKSSKSTS